MGSFFYRVMLCSNCVVAAIEIQKGSAVLTGISLAVVIIFLVDFIILEAKK